MSDIYDRPTNRLQIYRDVEMDLTGRPWFACSFIRCTLQRDYLDDRTGLHECFLQGCLLTGDGWLPEWLELQKAQLAAGLKLPANVPLDEFTGSPGQR